MKKYTVYIIGILLVAALVILFFTGEIGKKNRRIDNRVTLKRQDKIPYGTYVAYQDLKYIFPNATISTNKLEPWYWDSLSNRDSDQALIIMCPNFRADKYEMQKLIDFIENGNDVFISTRYITPAASKIIKCSIGSYDMDEINGEMLDDSMHIKLGNPPFAAPVVYSYPGKSFDTYLSNIDSNRTDVLGYSERGKANFIHMRAGRGNLYVHAEPLAFSNYFVLHKDNKTYYEKALSVIDPAVTKVVWDEYFLNKREFYSSLPRNKKGWFNTLMNLKNSNDQRSFRPAFWLLMGLLLLYVLLGMRRKQKYIPVMSKPRNDSLDFVKTIGRLYYERGDHKNLCRKMASYFLEYVRNKYKLATGTLDDKFIQQLRFKTGVDETEIRRIVTFIKFLDNEPVISAASLTDFHRQLESFYKKA